MSVEWGGSEVAGRGAKAARWWRDRPRPYIVYIVADDLGWTDADERRSATCSLS
jgi:hypothetical protein